MDYTTQLFGDYNKPSKGSLSNNQYLTHLKSSLSHQAAYDLAASAATVAETAQCAVEVWCAG